MAYVTNNTRMAAQTSTLSSLRARFDALRARFGAWRLYRRTLSELNQLSDRELADLGLSRSALQSVAWHAVYGR